MKMKLKMKLMSIALAFAVFALDCDVSLAAESSLSILKNEPTPKNDCAAIESQYKKSLSPKTKKGAPFFLEAEVPHLLEMLGTLKVISHNLDAEIARSYSEAPEATYQEVVRLSAGECPSAVQRVLKVLINTAADSDTPQPAKKKISAAIRLWYEAPRIPTLSRVIIDRQIVSFAAERQLWLLDAEKSKRFQTEEVALQKLINEINKGIWGTEKPNYGPNEANAVSMANIKNFKKIKPVLIRESKEASQWILSAKKLVESLP
jgi:hypothetical protein